MYSLFFYFFLLKFRADILLPSDIQNYLSYVIQHTNSFKVYSKYMIKLKSQLSFELNDMVKRSMFYSAHLDKFILPPIAFPTPLPESGSEKRRAETLLYNMLISSSDELKNRVDCPMWMLNRNDLNQRLEFLQTWYI